MRKLTLLRRMLVVNGLSAAAIVLLAMASQNTLAQTIHEPHTTLRIIEPDCTVAESFSETSTREPRESEVAIRGRSVDSTLKAVTREVVPSGDVATRLRLDVAAGGNQSSTSASHASEKTEVRLRPVPDSSRIFVPPVAGGVAVNTLRAEEVIVGWPSDTALSNSALSDRPATFVSSVASRPNVLRMGDRSATSTPVRAVSYQNGPTDRPSEQADTLPPEEPRQRTFSASPLNAATERLGPFEVTDQLEVLDVVQRCGKVLRSTRKVARTEVADPNVCTVVQFTPGELSIVGNQAGQTQVTFWFEDLQGEPISYLIHVVPNPLAR